MIKFQDATRTRSGTEILVARMPLIDLVTVRQFAAKDDVRFYLKGVHLEQRRITATDGHRLMSMPLVEESTLHGVIIPSEAIDRLSKQLTAKQRKTADIIIRKGDDKTLILESNGAIVHCTPVDGRFPDVDRVIPDLDSLPANPANGCAFDWSYLGDFYKAVQTLTDHKKPIVTLHHGSDCAARLVAEDYKTAVMVVMPMRVMGE